MEGDGVLDLCEDSSCGVCLNREYGGVVVK